ncbi:MAG: hypothetical protein IPN34_02955 [Planctomycetes bacterium]|nr:hypothetical protein [Planctomycetota bacterium]
MTGRAAFRHALRAALALIGATGLAAFLGVPLPPFERAESSAWRELAVRLVDVSGTPAGDIVVLLTAPGAQGSTELARAKTDERGVARFRVELPLPPRTRLQVDLPLEKAPELDAAAIAEAIAFVRPVDLSLPAFAGLTVRVEDERGSPLREPVPVKLHWRESGDAPTSVERLRGWSQVARRGVASFARVAPGRRWRLTAEDPAGRSPFQAWEGEGPFTSGDTREVVLRRMAPWPRLLGVAVDERGASLAGVAILAAFPSGTGEAPLAEGAWIRATCDERGRFEIVQRSSAPNARRVRLRTADQMPRETEIELGSASDRSGLRDLGVAVLRLPPVLVAGLVLDARGAPVSRAWIELAAYSEGQRDEEAQILIPAARCTDADGRFELRGRSSAHLLLVRSGTHEHALARFAGVPSGTLELRLQLAPSTSLAGQVILDPGFAASELRVRLALPDGRSCASRPEPDGRFRFEGLPHGRWTPELHAASGRVLALDELAVSERTPPIALDARGRLAELALRWSPPAGTAQASAELEDALGRRAPIELRRDEIQRWVVAKGRAPYRLHLPGCEPIRVELGAPQAIAVQARGR